VWWDQTTEIVAYLDRSTVHLRVADRVSLRERPRSVAATSHRGLSDALHGAMRESLLRKGRLRVLLGSSICRFLLLQETDRLRNTEEVKALGTAMLKERLGLEPLEWTLAVDRNWGASASVCALRKATLEELRAAARESGCQLASVRPWISELISNADRTFRRLKRIGVIEPDSVSLLSDLASSTQVRTLPVGGSIDPMQVLGYLVQGDGATPGALPTFRHEPSKTSIKQARGQPAFLDCLTHLAETP